MSVESGNEHEEAVIDVDDPADPLVKYSYKLFLKFLKTFYSFRTLKV
jgi:hypothetical protein